jgi:hypothetical protein
MPTVRSSRYNPWAACHVQAAQELPLDDGALQAKRVQMNGMSEVSHE